jgi:hypothetical protein
MDVGLVMMLVHQRDRGGGVLVVAPVLECCAGCGSTIACACGAHGCGIMVLVVMMLVVEQW